MATPPGVQVIESQPDCAYIVMASRLPLRSCTRIPRFLTATTEASAHDLPVTGDEGEPRIQEAIG